MDKWLEALAALGGFAAIGGLIDLAMYKTEKAKLKAKLEDWWLRFNEVNWSNFGRKEAELSIQILDRVAGPKLGGKRLWFCTKVTIVVWVCTSLWVFLRFALLNPLRDDEELTQAFKYSITSPLGVYPVVFIAFAASLSVTRYLASMVVRFSRGPIFNATAFAILLASHVLLLVYWSGFVLALAILPNVAVMVLDEFRRGADLQLFLEAFRKDPPKVFVGTKLGLMQWKMLFDWHPYHPRFEAAGALAFKAAMDVIANGIRIVFALVFLSSFVAGPQIKGFISRLWYGAMDSGKPVFTTLFGLLGAFVAAARILAK
jgi:hypothetical protein